MANNITNSLQFLKCTKRRIEDIYEKYSTFHKSEHRETPDGRLIYKKGDTVGWLNKSTGIFEVRYKKGRGFFYGEIPYGFVPYMSEPSTEFPDFNKIIPQPRNIFLEEISKDDKIRLRKEGIPNWYDWNCEFWGTKWSAYSCRTEKDRFLFETAWSGVPNVVRELSAQNPDIEIVYKYYDEDLGRNLGQYIFVNGTASCEYFPEDDSQEAYQLILEVNPNESESFETTKDGTIKRKIDDD